MEFEGSSPIYLQIGDYICNNILKGAWQPGERIPSVRELAMDVEANPNTVMRTYAHLQEQEIIYNKRGIGYFVAEDALKAVRAMKTREFVENELPRVFAMMDLLGLGFEDLKSYYQRYKNGQTETE
jgi:DNA-binding transcriptional regulator YhcF (GntR family)